jgi:hypothetical protein
MPASAQPRSCARHRMSTASQRRSGRRGERGPRLRIRAAAGHRHRTPARRSPFALRNRPPVRQHRASMIEEWLPTSLVLFAAVCLGAGRAPYAAPIEPRSIVLAGSEFAAGLDDGGDGAAEGSSIAQMLALPRRCAGDAEVLRPPGVDCAAASPGDRAASLPSSGSASALIAGLVAPPFEIGTGAIAFDIAPIQSAFAGFRTQPSGIWADRLDDLVSVADQTDDKNPSWATGGDIFAKYAVPALAALALLVAGLLLGGFMRWRRRVALARRIKRNSARSRRHPRSLRS